MPLFQGGCRDPGEVPECTRRRAAAFCLPAPWEPELMTVSHQTRQDSADRGQCFSLKHESQAPHNGVSFQKLCCKNSLESLHNCSFPAGFALKIMIWLISTGWKLSFLVTLQSSPCQSRQLGTCMGLFVINLTGIWKTFSKFDLYFVLQISQCQAASRMSYLSKTERRRWNYNVVNSDFP